MWVQIPTEKINPGNYTIEISFENDKKEYLGKTSFELEILEIKLPKPKLKYTQWFHPDCLVSYYEVEAFSEKHWEIIDNFIKTAAENGVNTLLTPLFTLPLDTVVGGERPTTQLSLCEERRRKIFFWVR